jgi:hypothetical protein
LSGDNAIVQALQLLYDQRGEDRIEDGNDDLVEHVDIGGFELGADEFFGGP